ncbi:MAG: hypothetical protein R2873_24995 [Caldilineaceae bacterium]
MANKSVAVSREGGREAASLHQSSRKRRWLSGDMALAVIVLLPSIIAVGIFIYGFIGWTFYISTVDWKSAVPDYTFVGLKNWIRMLNDRRFHADMRNLLFYAIGFMSQCILLGSCWLPCSIKRSKARRSSAPSSFPFAVSGVVTGAAWRWLMQPTTGDQLIFANIGLGWFRTRLASSNVKYGIWASTYLPLPGTSPGMSWRSIWLTCVEFHSSYVRRRPSMAQAHGPPIAM